MDDCCIFGDCGLGQTHTEDAPSDTLVEQLTKVQEAALETAVGKEQPIYKKAWFWAAVGGGVAVVGGGAYYLTRKKKAA
jgi:LPXTG-motif cell wall-anchored protein